MMIGRCNRMYLPPSLPERAELPFDDERYVFEPKIDGQRLLLSLENGTVRLYSRYGRDVTGLYPELSRVPVRDGSDLVLDGEVAMLEPDTGFPRYEDLQIRFRLRKELDIREASVRRPVHYFVFDVLRYRGRDLRSLPLAERKAILAEALDDNGVFNRLAFVRGGGRDVFESIRRIGLEGMVAKRADRPYVAGRTGDWLAIPNYRFANLRISGYRKDPFGWLVERDGEAEGVLDRNIPAAYRQAFQGIAKELATGEDRNFVYVKPAIEARVRYVRRTKAGRLWEPEFLGFVV